jgi:hypothetical protein
MAASGTSIRTPPARSDGAQRPTQEAELPRTEDGSVFLEELQAVFEELEVDPRVRDMLTGLLAEQVDSPASGD